MGHVWKAAHFHGKSGFFLHLTQAWTKVWTQAWLLFLFAEFGRAFTCYWQPCKSLMYSSPVNITYC